MAVTKPTGSGHWVTIHGHPVFIKATRAAGGEVLVDGKPAPPHIAALRIPPAWTHLEISKDPEADLLVRGRDAKGRVQCIYSDNHKTRQAAAKFARVRDLAQEESVITAQNKKNLSHADPLTREAAAATSLILAMGVRPGSERDTGAEKQAYGATTLLGRHVVEGANGAVRLKFVGKKGVSLNLPVEDPVLASMLKSRASDKTSRLFNVSDAELRAYVGTLGGGGFHPKDLRTLRGTMTAIAEVKGRPAPKNMKEYKRAVKEVATVVSQKLGNTPSVALQSYIDPTVFAKWRPVE